MIGPDILTLFPAGQDLLGKQAGELVGEDLTVWSDGSVTGTFKRVTGYTGFSSEPADQEGYFFPFRLGGSGTKMTFKKNGKPTKTNIPFDQDIIFRIEKDTIYEVLVDDERIVTLRFDKAKFLK